MNKYREKITEDLIEKFKNMSLNMQLDEDNIKKYIEILKNNLKQEYKKLTQENINLLKDKYNFEIHK